ncbi:MAG: radical SAM protein [Theionarchaea archaeon]|nr:radical SAM protein [Theionarchaea archaeon]
MSTKVTPFVTRRIENHYIFLFPDIPYWFIVDSEEKHDIVVQLFDNIQQCESISQATETLLIKGQAPEELKDLIRTLEKAGVFTPFQNQPPRPVPHLPRIAQVSVEVTKACNLTCQHCSVTGGTPRKDELTFQEIHTFLTEAVQLMKGRKEVVITGGEPFLRSDIFEILEICHDLKFKRILFLTNGTLITKEIGVTLGDLNRRIEKQNTSEKLIQRLYVQVSIDGAESTHDLIRGKNSWKRAIQGTKILKDNGISTTIGMVLNTCNIKDVEAVIELASKLDCSVGFSSMVKTGRATQKNLKPVPASRIIPIVMQYIERDPRYLKYLTNFPCSPYIIAFQNLIKFRYCGTGWATVYLNSIGDIYPCQIGATVPEFKAGNIRDTPFSEIWEHAPILKKLRKLHVDSLNDQCSKCEIRYFCGGGCRTEAYLNTGSINGMDPKCLMDENKETAWGALQLMVKYPQVLQEVSELGIVRLMEDLFEEMST